MEAILIDVDCIFYLIPDFNFSIFRERNDNRFSGGEFMAKGMDKGKDKGKSSDKKPKKSIKEKRKEKKEKATKVTP